MTTFLDPERLAKIEDRATVTQRELATQSNAAPAAILLANVDVPDLIAEVKRLSGELTKYVGWEPTVKEEYEHACGELVLAVNLESRPGKVLRITGVHKLIRNAATVDEALGLLAPDYPFVATVHRPGLPDVHLGFAFQHQAELACWSLTEDLIGTAHVEGTTVTWSPTPDGVCPQPPVLADAPAVASLVEQELADVPPEHRFPDLFSRLKAQEGYETASRIWRDACRSLDDAEADA